VSAILLADDNPHAQRMGSQILSQEGHNVVTVSDGDEAMQYLEENLPDLVMVDTRMPGPSGFDICKHIKSQPKFGAVKVVLLAGPLEPFDTAEAENAGPDGVLHKPLDAYTLIDTVNSLLGKVPEAQDHAVDNEAARPAAAARPQPMPAAAPMIARDRVPAATAPAKTAAAVASKPATAVAALSIDLSEHFASVVEEALGTENSFERQRERVEAVVRDVLESAMPAIVQSITERVMASLEEE
jgi:twitching motility two-component system response regulator PilH